LPLDGNFCGDTYFYQKAVWRRRFSWLPHRCDCSGRIIWLAFGYLGTAMYTGPGTPVFEYHWHHEYEHVVWLIKNGKV